MEGSQTDLCGRKAYISKSRTRLNQVGIVGLFSSNTVSIHFWLPNDDYSGSDPVFRPCLRPRQHEATNPYEEIIQ